MQYVSPSRQSRFTTRTLLIVRNPENVMCDINKKFATFLISCTLLGGACDSDLAPEVAHNAAAVTQAELSLGEAVREMDGAGETNLAVDDLDITPIDEAVQLRMGELPDGTFGVTEGAGGRAIGPGVWEVETQDGLVQQVIMGAEGQQWLIGQMTAELDGLRGKVSNIGLYAGPSGRGLRPELVQRWLRDDHGAVASMLQRRVHAAQHRHQHGLLAAVDGGCDSRGERPGLGAGVRRPRVRDQPGLLLLVS